MFVVMFLLFLPSALAQNFSGGVTIYLPPEDTLTQRFLPAFPAHALTSDDGVRIDADGHFAVGGSRVRFFGANLVAGSAFPTPGKAWFIAGRLRKMGFNLVRLHHMDNPWTSESLFEQGSDTRHLNTAMLDRLDLLLAALKENGIYADVNLHVSRTFTAADGVPKADSLAQYAKAVTFFDPYLIMLQKEFARQLLTHVNPHTGLSLSNDPVMAMLEVTNENSLYRWWREGRLKPYGLGGSLIMEHTAMLDSLWMRDLRRKYPSTAALAAAWDPGPGGTEGPNLLQNPSFELSSLSPWVLEVNAPATGEVLPDTLTAFSGHGCARILITATDGTGWNLQLEQAGLSLTKDSLYTVTFAAKADRDRTIDIAVLQDIAPWNTYAGTTVTVTPSWQRYLFTFAAPATDPGTARLAFAVAQAPGQVWIDDARFVRSGSTGLSPDESFEAGTVRRLDFAECMRASDQRVRDMTEFYLGIQNAYFDQMRSFLRDTLGVRVPIVGSNWNVGPPDVASQSHMDYIDNHSYWDHPFFPGTPWSPTDWSIMNTPMVRNAEGGTIGWLTAGVPMRGKPFTISEYNHAFPNRYQPEGILFLSAYGAFHEADAIMFFDYNTSSDNWEVDWIDGYFDIHRNTAMMALMPSCALAYRRGLIGPARQTITISYTSHDLLLLPKRDNRGWPGFTLVPPTLALVHAVRNERFDAASTTDPAALPSPASPFVSDNGEIVWDAAGSLTVGSAKFAGYTGILEANTPMQAGELTLLGSSAPCTITWVALDGQPLVRSRLSLVTLSTRAQNSGMVWDGTSTVHDNWGVAPTTVEPLIARLRLHIAADSLRVYPLSTTGAGEGYVTCLPSDTNSFTVPLDQSSTPTPWFGIEALGSGTTAMATAGSTLPLEFGLSQNYPNPFNPSTSVTVALPHAAHVTLVIYDLLGRRVETLASGMMAAGVHTLRWNGAGRASGVYLCRLEARHSRGVFSASRKLLLTR